MFQSRHAYPVPQDHTSARWHAWSPAAITGAQFLVATGILVRLLPWLLAWSLTHSEAALACRIIQQPLGTLLRPCSTIPSAPVGFLLIQKLLTFVLGDGERALRLLPLFSGVLILFMGYRLARRYLPPSPAILLLAMLAFADPLVIASTQFSPASSDAALTMAFLCTAFLAIHQPSRQYLYVWTALAAAGLWYSQTAIFTIAATGLALLLWHRDSPDPHRLRFLIAALAIVAVSFALSYWLFPPTHAQPSPNPWNDGLMPHGAPLAGLTWLLGRFVRIFTTPLGLIGAIPVLLFTCAGLWTTFRPSAQPLGLIPGGAALALGGAGLGLLAGIFRLLPFDGPLMAFATPGLCLAITLGAASTWRLPIGTWRLLIPLAAIAMLIPCALTALWPTRPTTDFRPLINHLAKDTLPNDAVFVMDPAGDLFACYARHLPVARGLQVRNQPPTVDLLAQVRQVKSSRLWLLFCDPDAAQRQQQGAILSQMDQLGWAVDRFDSGISTACLYELTPGRWPQLPSAPVRPSQKKE